MNFGHHLEKKINLLKSLVNQCLSTSVPSLHYIVWLRDSRKRKWSVVENGCNSLIQIVYQKDFNKASNFFSSFIKVSESSLLLEEF